MAAAANAQPIANLQNRVHENEEVREIIQRSRFQTLPAADWRVLFEHRDELGPPLNGYIIPPRTEGLFRTDVRQYADSNNWAPGMNTIKRKIRGPHYKFDIRFGQTMPLEFNWGEGEQGDGLNWVIRRYVVRDQQTYRMTTFAHYLLEVAND